MKTDSAVPAVLLLAACLLLAFRPAASALITVFLIIVLLVAVPMLVINLHNNRADDRGAQPRYPTFRSSDGRHTMPRPERGERGS